jgi:hypothetical protein
MCASSAVSDYYMHTYPERFPQNPYPFGNPLGGFGGTSDYETREMMRQVLVLLDKIDKRLGDIECKDEAKAAFYKSVGADYQAEIKGG